MWRITPRFRRGAIPTSRETKRARDEAPPGSAGGRGLTATRAWSIFPWFLRRKTYCPPLEVPVDPDMNKNIVTLLGLALVLMGVIGFFVPHLMGMHLTPFHNFVHLFSGAFAIFFGVKGTPRAARNFCFAFGAVYGLLAVAGFLGGHADSRLLTVIPGHFELGTADHFVHVLVAAAFLVVGAMIKPYARVERM